MAQKYPKIYLTIDQANKLLPVVENIISKLVKLNTSLNALTSLDLEFEEDYEQLGYEIEFNIKFHDLSCEFYREYEKLLKLGAILKDLEYRIVDFYSTNGGKEIFLCWQLGEKEIEFWHSVEEDFNGRKSLSILKRNT